MSANFIYFSERNNRWEFVGIFSSKYIDTAKSPDIISSDAHRTYESKFNSGEAMPPFVYLWHVPIPIGEVYSVIYLFDAFMCCAGYFYEEYSDIAMKLSTQEGLGMSHGMDLKDIKRDPNDNSVITEYISYEVTILPLKNAANVFTLI